MAVSGMLGFLVAMHKKQVPITFMFVRDGSRELDLMLKREVGVMKNLMEIAGYIFDNATASGEPMVGETTTLTPTVNLGEVDMVDYAGIVLPCMGPAAGYPMPEKVDALVAQAVMLGLPIAVARGSISTLAKAGGMYNRKYSFATKVDTDERPEFAGGTFMGTGVVRDANIITSAICPMAARKLNMPDGTEGLTQAFIEALADAGGSLSTRL